MRNNFDAQLAHLNDLLSQMGALCEEVIASVSKALSDKDTALAEKVVTVDAEIDRKEREVESICLKLLLQQQPVARDLRQISAALKMITDMERIGDQAADIAEMVRFLQGHPTSECEEPMKNMAVSVISMVTESVEAFVKQDIDLAKEAIRRDDVVDEYFDSIKKHLIARIAETPRDGEYALDLLMIAKYLERIGDHAVNIAEWVIFSVTGEHEREPE